jgi:hypothetical protein
MLLYTYYTASYSGWCQYEDPNKFGYARHNKRWYFSRFHLYTKPVILISLFDGIGAAVVAMQKSEENGVCPLTIVHEFSSEINEQAIEVADRFKSNLPYTSTHLGDVEQISAVVVKSKIMNNPWVRQMIDLSPHDDEYHILVVAGSPCQGENSCIWLRWG